MVPQLWNHNCPTQEYMTGPFEPFRSNIHLPVSSEHESGCGRLYGIFWHFWTELFFAKFLRQMACVFPPCSRFILMHLYPARCRCLPNRFLVWVPPSSRLPFARQSVTRAAYLSCTFLLRPSCAVSLLPSRPVCLCCVPLLYCVNFVPLQPFSTLILFQSDLESPLFKTNGFLAAPLPSGSPGPLWTGRKVVFPHFSLSSYFYLSFPSLRNPAAAALHLYEILYESLSHAR